MSDSSQGRTPWQVLELAPDSGRQEIKLAYRHLARRYHPDLNPDDPEAATRFLEVCDAYQRLVSPVEQVEEAREPESPALHVPVSFLTAYQGGELVVELPTLVTCRRCGGRGCHRCERGRAVEKRSFAVDIPRGVEDGAVLKAIEAGEGYRQQITIVADVASSRLFARLPSHPEDLLLNLPVTFAEAALGATVRLPTPSEVVNLKIPAGTAHGKIFKLADHGMPRKGTEERGDLIIRIDVQVPTELSAAQRRALEELARHDKDPRQRLLEI